MLGVPHDVIAASTAVSQAVAEAMARGVLERCPADVAVAITGVAGPEPDEDGNPVGLMHVAVAARGRSILRRKHQLGQDTRAGSAGACDERDFAPSRRCSRLHVGGSVNGSNSNGIGLGALLSLLIAAGRDWLRHRDARVGAALAYYSVFSLWPLLLIVVSVAGLVFGAESVTTALRAQFKALLGPTGSQAVEAMLTGAGSRTGGTLSAKVGVILLLVAVIGVVVQLKDALSTIWEIDSAAGSGLWGYVRTYLVSFAGIMGLGFLLAMSLVVYTALSSVSGWLGGGEAFLWQLVNFLVSLVVLAALFAMLFK